MDRRKITSLAVGAALLGSAGFVLAGLPTTVQASEMTVYKSDSCGCCGGWVEHIRKAGYAIRIVPTDDLATVKARLGVPESLWSCHTAVVDGKVIEGHVPAIAVNAFLKAPGTSRGIGVSGMPIGAPGMEAPGYAPDRYDVMRFGAGRTAPFMTFRGAQPAAR